MEYDALIYALLQKMEDRSETVLQELIKKSDDEKFTYETNNRDHYLYALHGIDFLIVLWGLDQWLRSQIKYNEEHQEETKQGFVLAREQLYDLMQERDLSFDMLK